MKKWKQLFIFWAFVISVLVFSSCTSLKKTTKTTIVEKFSVDTVYKVKYDTVTVVKTSFRTDTVKIENKTAKAKAYYNINTQKITMELTGKIFNVPVSMEGVRKTTIKEKEKKKNPTFKIMVIIALVFMGEILILKIIQK